MREGKACRDRENHPDFCMHSDVAKSEREGTEIPLRFRTWMTDGMLGP